MFIVAFALYAAADGTITTETGDLTLSPASGNILLDGKLGIGGNTPSYPLHVYVQNPTSYAGYIYNTDPVDGRGLFIRTANSASVNAVTVKTGAGYVFTILNNGNVGVGTTSPSHKLTVAGKIYTTGLWPNAGLIFNHHSIFEGTDHSLRIWNNGDNPIYLLPGGGNVGVGTTGATEKLTVDGNIQASGKIKLKRPDGAYACCGPDNTNQWVCTNC